MRYRDLTFGQTEALVRKLGGMPAVRRILSDRTEIGPWKTIEIGGWADVSILLKRLEQEGYRLNSLVASMLRSSTFKLVPAMLRVELVVYSVADLGFRHEPVFYQAICERVKEEGFFLCPVDVGPELRLCYSDQPMDERLTVASEAIATEAGLRLFSLDRPPSAPWLDACGAGLRDQWFLHNELVFARSIEYAYTGEPA